ncbi:MAG: hypothetical protein CL693_20735 [Cellvibrionaceae bacterium]|nr:hypothetical protein [Cellvibrionaceae bacterium]|tara:strand:- start:44572 stop:44892 length:321 start_codon:yes stop_codon:yes gene_type:complete
MACCIFAAMIITNFLVIYRRIKGFLGFKVEDGSLWQPEENGKTKASLWRRSLSVAIPVFMIGSTAAYGTLHWHHIIAWMEPSYECDSSLSHRECAPTNNASQHPHH